MIGERTVWILEETMDRSLAGFVPRLLGIIGKFQQEIPTPAVKDFIGKFEVTPVSLVESMLRSLVSFQKCFLVLGNRDGVEPSAYVHGISQRLELARKLILHAHRLPSHRDVRQFEYDPFHEIGVSPRFHYMHALPCALAFRRKHTSSRGRSFFPSVFSSGLVR